MKGEVIVVGDFTEGVASPFCFVEIVLTGAIGGAAEIAGSF